MPGSPEDFADLLGMQFMDTPTLLECGSTSLRADVPSQAPILPLATTAVAVVAASEVIKSSVGLAPLDNWLAHDPAVTRPALGPDAADPSRPAHITNSPSDDLRKECEEIRSRGVEIVLEPEDYQFGVRATAVDPDGNRIELRQPNRNRSSDS